MPAMQGWHFLTLWDLGAKTCQFNLKVYDVLYLYISTPLSDAGCSKHSGQAVLPSANDAKRPSVGYGI